MKVGLDLTEIKIKKSNEFLVIQESISNNIEKAMEASKNVGIDLTKEKGSDRIDLVSFTIEQLK